MYTSNIPIVFFFLQKKIVYMRIVIHVDSVIVCTTYHVYMLYIYMYIFFTIMYTKADSYLMVIHIPSIKPYLCNSFSTKHPRQTTTNHMHRCTCGYTILSILFVYTMICTYGYLRIIVRMDHTKIILVNIVKWYEDIMSIIEDTFFDFS